MVGYDCEIVVMPVGVKRLYGCNVSQCLLLSAAVVLFMFVDHPTTVGNDPFLPALLLTEDCIHGITRGIGVDLEWPVEV